VQILPQLVDDAASITVYQRTPNYVSPGNSPALTDDDRRDYRENHEAIQAQVRANPLFQAYTLAGFSAGEAPADERLAVYERAWAEGGLAPFMATHADLAVDQESNDTIAEFIREKIRLAVHDPDKARKLVPTDYPYGVKRPPSSDGYYEAFNREHVDVVDLRATPIERITAGGIVVRGQWMAVPGSRST
jgi:cation diffusion facilitator CzcD-associated flavoprotein CzcO